MVQCIVWHRDKSSRKKEVPMDLQQPELKWFNADLAVEEMRKVRSEIIQAMPPKLLINKRVEVVSCLRDTHSESCACPYLELQFYVHDLGRQLDGKTTLLTEALPGMFFLHGECDLVNTQR